MAFSTLPPIKIPRTPKIWASAVCGRSLPLRGCPADSLALPRDDIWTHGGSEPGHSLGNVAFTSEGKLSSHLKVKVGPKGEYSEPIFQNNRIFIMTPNGYVVVYNDKGQFLWEVSILPEGTKAKNEIFGGLAINKDRLAIYT